MNRALSLFVIGLIFGGGIGFTIAAGNGVTFDGHDHSNPAHHGGGAAPGETDHALLHATPIDVPAEDAPQLDIQIHPDPMAGYNLRVTTRNFEFSPENVSGKNVTGEGHAHVYVNGEKLGRLYGEWLHLDALPHGEVEVKVTLNSNDHRPISVNGTPVAARQIILVEGTQ